MHARVAAFENRDPSLTDELISRIRSAIDTGEPPPGATGLLMLVDRERGTSLGISIFESEQAIRDAEPMFQRMGDEYPEEMRGRRTTVEAYEVAISEGGDDAKAARVSLLEGSPDRLDEGTRYAQEEILPQVRQRDGFKGVVSLVDRERGRTKLITPWESDSAPRASEAQATD